MQNQKKKELRLATLRLLKHRKGTSHVTVQPFSLEGALPNHCFQNAAKMAQTNEAIFIVVPGWLVGESYGYKGTAIIPHYWVFDVVSRQHYDPTPKGPLDTQNYEYVLDNDFFKCATSNAYFPLPLRILENGKLQAVGRDGKFIDLKRLNLVELFEMAKF